jgi:hypothetical protein
MSAAASVASVVALAKARISRTFGSRKVDDYLKDETFWTDGVAGAALRTGSREAAMLLLASR